jgi:hypothetical protein
MGRHLEAVRKLNNEDLTREVELTTKKMREMKARADASEKIL